MLSFTVVHRESLHKKRSEARASAATEGMEDEESLEPGALVRQLPHPVQHQVDDLLADGVVTPRVVVGGVLLAGHQLLGVEQLPVGPGPNLQKYFLINFKNIQLMMSKIFNEVKNIFQHF